MSVAGASVDMRGYYGKMAVGMKGDTKGDDRVVARLRFSRSHSPPSISRQVRHFSGKGKMLVILNLDGFN